jgi:hypothetical protein
MTKFTSPLDNIKVASPCSANWDEMYGNDRKRFCSECKLNVYNLSGMSKEQAENLLINSEGRICVRFYRRRDGSVITQDCPVGWQRLKQRTQAIITAVFSLVMGMFGGLASVSMLPTQDRNADVGRMLVNPTPEPRYQTMGAVAADPGSAADRNLRLRVR